MKNPRTQVSIPNFVCGSLSAAKRILLQALFGRTGDQLVDKLLFMARIFALWTFIAFGGGLQDIFLGVPHLNRPAEIVEGVVLAKPTRTGRGRRKALSFRNGYRIKTEVDGEIARFYTRDAELAALLEKKVGSRVRVGSVREYGDNLFFFWRNVIVSLDVDGESVRQDLRFIDNPNGYQRNYWNPILALLFTIGILTWVYLKIAKYQKNANLTET